MRPPPATPLPNGGMRIRRSVAGPTRPMTLLADVDAGPPASAGHYNPWQTFRLVIPDRCLIRYRLPPEPS